MKTVLFLPLILITFISNGQNTTVVQILDIKTLNMSEGKYYDTDGKLFNGRAGFLLNQDDSMLLQVRNGIVSQKIVKKIGRKDAYIEYFRENGVIDRSRYFVNNKFEGIARFYSDKGKVERVVNYHEGKRQGSDIWYFENGKIKDKWYYINDKLEGRCDSFGEDGTISSIQNYRDGKLEGLFLVFTAKGILSSITMYVNGEKNGVEEFYMNGKVSKIISYSSDKQISVNDNPIKSIYQNTLKSFIEEFNQPVIEEQSKSQVLIQSVEETDPELAEFLKGPTVGGVESGEIVKPYKFSKGIPFASTINTASDKRYYSESELNELDNPVNIIGKPIQIGKLLVAENEFPKKSDWNNANVVCLKLGPGWRLPTKDELYILYQNKNILRNFSKYAYWSSTEGSMNGNNGVAYYQDFTLGSTKPILENKLSTWGVRAVKSL